MTQGSAGPGASGSVIWHPECCANVERMCLLRSFGFRPIKLVTLGFEDSGTATLLLKPQQPCYWRGHCLYVEVNWIRFAVGAMFLHLDEPKAKRAQPCRLCAVTPRSLPFGALVAEGPAWPPRVCCVPGGAVQRSAQLGGAESSHSYDGSCPAKERSLWVGPSLGISLSPNSIKCRS